jgi:hypothetical protein
MPARHLAAEDGAEVNSRNQIINEVAATFAR